MAEFRLLGPMEAWTAGQPVVLGPAKQRTVLAVLLLEARCPVSMEVLIDRIWDGPPPAEARSVLYAHITRIRRLLADMGADGTPMSLHRRGGGYMLDIPYDAVDLHRFRNLVEQARAADADQQRAGLLREALDLWCGAPLADLQGGWVTRVREGLAQQRLDTVLAWAQAELALGRAGTVAEELRELVVQHPLMEPLVAQLMRALHLDGRSAEALKCYARTRQHLVEELGTEPGPELSKLHTAILRGTLGHPRPSAQLAAPRRVVPAQLPAAVGAFTGRAEDLARLDALLAGGPPDGDQPGSVAILVITGTAGVGKTALAVHWAHSVRECFPDGQLYLDLRGYSQGPPVRPIEVLAGFLRALGVAAEQIPVDLDQAAGLYRSLLAARRVLVVLDNARDAEHARHLLPGGPGCLVLVTSRDRLGGLVATHGARRLTLDVLTRTEAVALLTRILGQGRVQAEAEATAELAELCGFLPLALRIAAANLACHPEQAIADHVAELHAQGRLDALAVDDDPQAAVRAAFDRSYQTLAADARRLFGLLGLVPGADFTPEAAAALAGTTPPRAARLLDRLAGAHLLQPRGGGRFAFHDLLRLYARELAAQHHPEPERAAALTRVLGFYTATAWRTLALLRPGHVRLSHADARWTEGGLAFVDAAAALEWLEAERPNLMAAAAQAAATPAVPGEVVPQLAHALFGFFLLRSYLDDWVRVNQIALATAERIDDQAAQAKSHNDLGAAYHRQGRSPEALAHLEASLTLHRELGDRRNQASNLTNLGLVAERQGRYDQAVACQQQSLVLFREVGERRGQSISLGNLGVAYERQGRYDEALAAQHEGLAICRELGDRHGEGISLGNVGVVCARLGRYDEALASLHEGLAICRELGDRRGQAETLGDLGMVYAQQGCYDQALASLHEGLKISEQLGDGYGRARAMRELGRTLAACGRHEEAREHWRQALALFEQLQVPEAAEVRALLDGSHPS